MSEQEAPHLKRDSRLLHLSNDSAFISAIHEYNETPEPMLKKKELLPKYLPKLRAVLADIENYRYKPEPPLGCPITAFGGAEDKHMPLYRLMPWQDQAADRFNWSLLPGDHFFSIFKKMRCSPRSIEYPQGCLKLSSYISKKM